MKVPKAYVTSNFFGGIIIILLGVYYQSRHFDNSGFNKIGFLAVAISLVLWQRLGILRIKLG
jgi:uncharacterized membrane protein YjjP (DUF1212 family)